MREVLGLPSAGAQATWERVNMTEYTIPAANWPDELSAALRQAVPGDTVIVRTEPMRLLAETEADRMGKTGLTIKIADKLSD